jgi:hypothetical protein
MARVEGLIWEEGQNFHNFSVNQRSGRGWGEDMGLDLQQGKFKTVRCTDDQDPTSIVSISCDQVTGKEERGPAGVPERFDTAGLLEIPIMDGMCRESYLVGDSLLQGKLDEQSCEAAPRGPRPAVLIKRKACRGARGLKDWLTFPMWAV